MQNRFAEAVRNVRAGRQGAGPPCLWAAWAAVLLAACAAAGHLDRTGKQWAPFLEWSLSNPSHSGNPYDLAASATFRHAETGETRTTGMFYAGGHTWRFRFTGTRPGRWTFVTSSKDPELDGHRGTVTVEPNPGVPGFVTHVGNRWARTGTDRVFVPQLVMAASPDRFYDRPEKVEADIQTFLVQHGFNGFHTYVACRWFDLHQMRSDRIRSGDPDPDPRTFEALEMLITRTHAAGGMVHIWAWGDEQRRWTPARWGLNGPADKRLQRTIAARLGPLPGWTMGYGFDLWEWVTEADLREWHRTMHRHMGWPHLLGARAHKNRLTQIYEGLDYAGYEQHRPDYALYVRTLEKRPGKPAFSEDRFRIRQRDQYAHKDYTPARTRRGLWHSTLAGGVANIWGCLGGQSSLLGSKPYPKPHWIRTWARFFQGRFRRDMVRDNSLTDGLCLGSRDRRRYVFYKEDAAAVAFDLSAMPARAAAVAVDALQPYAELDLGMRVPRRHVWTAPRTSDWALAVGHFPD